MNKSYIESALNFLRKWEGCKLTAYKDGGGVWTIGYGITGPFIHEGLTITQPEAEDLLYTRAVVVAEGVKKAITRECTKNQFNALVCFAYNVGPAAFKGSTLLRLFNEHKLNETVAEQFLRWNHDNGKVVDGLTHRREAEQKLFLKSDLTI